MHRDGGGHARRRKKARATCVISSLGCVTAALQPAAVVAEAWTLWASGPGAVWKLPQATSWRWE
jgi:hypothetical protein